MKSFISKPLVGIKIIYIRLIFAPLVVQCFAHEAMYTLIIIVNQFNNLNNLTLYGTKRAIYDSYFQRRCEQMRKSQESFSEWLYKKRKQKQEQLRRGPIR